MVVNIPAEVEPASALDAARRERRRATPRFPLVDTPAATPQSEGMGVTASRFTEAAMGRQPGKHEPAGTASRRGAESAGPPCE